MSSDVTHASSSWYDFLGWLETNKRGLLWVAVGLIGASFLIAAYRWKASQTELAASEALLQLRPSGGPAGKQENVATATDYLKVVHDYPNTAAAERASIRAAGRCR